MDILMLVALYTMRHMRFIHNVETTYLLCLVNLFDANVFVTVGRLFVNSLMFLPKA
jgi:hypothetical protein